MEPGWKFWIDRGGTFTDCIGISPQGVLKTLKVLSSDDAPLIGIRRLQGLPTGSAIAPCEVRMGTTLATNALLERQGANTALVITKGFGDLLAIGTQARSELFELDIKSPKMLYTQVLEVEARLDAKGQVLAEPGPNLAGELKALRDRGITSLAIVVIHSYLDDTLERCIETLARRVGFSEISISSEVSGVMGMLGRGDTTVVDAYLTPLISRYLEKLSSKLAGSRILVMQSSGGLTSAARFRGKDAVLSGPAGGAIAYSKIAKAGGFDKAIGFDMGGTSTDVSCFEGRLQRSYESEVAGVRLQAPMIRMHTVAAGGSSLCLDNGFRLTVGPQSAGASPGPLCYGHSEAQDLTVTDCNLALGRIVDDRFPFALSQPVVLATLASIANDLTLRGIRKTPMEVADGFVQIANANMASALREVTTAVGRDLREYAMVVFGGAGGQHACPLARLLGVRTLIFHKLAGVLSAYGMGLATLSWHGQADGGRRELADFLELESSFSALERRGRRVLTQEGATEIRYKRTLDLRYRGTDSSLSIDCGPGALGKFRDEHFRQYGFIKKQVVEIVSIRVEVLAEGLPLEEKKMACPEVHESPAPLRMHKQWQAGTWQEIPVYEREQLLEKTQVRGPALILDSTGTIALDEGFTATVDSAQGSLIVVDENPAIAAPNLGDTSADPILIEIFSNLFMSISVQMGNALRDTSVSTNIRERLDFSCAVFDAQGDLVANAPHIPVHLGAMGESIRGILDKHPRPDVGSVFASNDPSLGGSHLPDITVVTPIHDSSGVLLFFTASRGHHADVGGIAPGSMPPFSRTLEDEGVVLRALQIVAKGTLDEVGLRKVLSDGKYPARCIDDNLADIRAQIAANQCGARLLLDVIAERGRPLVLAYMTHVQDNAAAQVAASIAALADGEYRFADAMDDGTPIVVCIVVQGSSMSIDFAGTGEQSRGNLNAPRAVTVAAVMYILRCMVGTSIPLNSGCLRSVKLQIEPGTILNPSPKAAVAAGNVETSQRVVDVLLGALGLSAASQGTMNNFTFGNQDFGYYETIAGGAGATATAPGASGVHTHMTNTRITDPEVLESKFPVRLCEFSLRPLSGGAGKYRGGDGLVREIEALAPLQVSMISERRTRPPFGLAGGLPGVCGANSHEGEALESKCSITLQVGEHFRIETPGGGGYGSEEVLDLVARRRYIYTK